MLALSAIVLLAACTSQTAAVTKSPTPPTRQQSPSEQPSATPADGSVLTIATIQRLNANVGFLAAWNGGGPALARTLDGGRTWHTVGVPASPITALRFIDANVGWAVGMIARPMQGVACQQAPPTAMEPCYGVVLKTTDGGATWRKSLLVPYYGTFSYPVQQIQAIDGQTAWVLVLDCPGSAPPADSFGCPAELRRTIDGGASWVKQTSGNIVAIRFATSSRGWIAVANSDGSFDVEVTGNGGWSWTKRLHTTSGLLVGLDAANALTAWAMTQAGGYCTATTCERYELFRTTDGGLSWSSLGNPKTSAAGSCSGGHLVGPLFTSPTSGWLAENTGAGGAAARTGLLGTGDGGRTWRCADQPAQTDMVSAADPQHLWALVGHHQDGSSTMFKSDDGGASWQQLDLRGLN